MKKLLLTTLSLLLFASATQAKDVQVKGYTKKDGTVVAGYTKTIREPETTKVKGYTKKDGTIVKGYERKKDKSTK